MAVIGINGLFVRPGRVGGAEFMLYNLLLGFGGILSPNDSLVVFTCGNFEMELPVNVRRRDIEPRYPGNRFLWESASLRAKSRGLKAILHPNYFTPPLGTAKRNVTVIHDLQYLHFPEHFSSQKRLWLRAAHTATLRWADAVVAISHFVRDDLTYHFGDRFASKICVIPNPISWSRFETPSADPSSAPPCILSVAAQYPHKNLHTLVEAFAKVHARRPELSLVLVGQVPSNLIGVINRTDLSKQIAELGLENSVTITGHVSDEELGRLYRRASLFVFPSLFEGFGMPVIEALGFGLPVLTTRCGSLPEVTRGLGHFVDDPLDSTEMAERILRMMASPDAYVPSSDQIDDLRTHYAPENIAAQYYAVMAPSA